MSDRSPQPNVVVFFTDQQRHDSTGLHGNPLGLTPNFDRLAHQHTHIANSFTCQPVCGPARSCLQTGQYATNTGVWRNGPGLAGDAVTLANCFNSAGYRTGYIGKWHLSDTGPDIVPREHRGGYQDWLASNTLESTSDDYHTRMWDENDNPVDLPGYRVDAVADAVIRYINDRSKESQPFFLFTSFIEPHFQNHTDDYPPPTGYREQYAGRWTPPDLAAIIGESGNGKGLVGGTAQQHLGGYWGMVKRLDEALGRITEALASLGIDDNTIVLFTSDHACHFKTRNGEYKRSCHESSIRVPTLFAGPGFVAGGCRPELVSLVDLPPTLLDACGIDVPQTMQGRSLMPRLRGEKVDWPEEVFVQISEASCARAVRTGRWKYCVTAEGNPDHHSDRYVESHLYDLKYDPYELTNLVEFKSHQRVRQVMQERLLRRLRDAGEAAPLIDPPATIRGAGQRTVTEAEAHQ